MPRLFSSQHRCLGGRNRFTLCRAISLLLLGTLCFFTVLQVHRNLQTEEVAVSAAPPPRIFCIITTFAYLHKYAAMHIHRTWAPHCDHYLFVSDDVDHYLEPAVFMNLHDKWQRMRAHLEYVYKYHFHEADWFLYANDNNFVVVENLRYMLKSYSPDELIYFGCKLRTPNGLVFMHGGSGIVLSAAALKRFTLDAMTNESICSSKDKGDEATEELGRCLTNVNVIPGNSRDEWQRHRFLPFDPALHLGGRMNESIEVHKYFLDHSYYPVTDMNLPVSLRFICSLTSTPSIIYNYYYFTYKVRRFGVPLNFESGEIKERL
uniref:N-acetylgalactosaminide beta-1,3-galactosyltransferase n=1 Tax=Drosophila rhopaloa TaxID=1041015 RepID=A0A6P4F503_DRORH